MTSITDSLQKPKFEDIFFSLRATAKHPSAIVKETKQAVAIAREFNDQVSRSRDLQLDATKQENPDHLPWEIVQEGNRWGFYTMFIPKAFGGKGYNLSCLGPFLEEISSVCLAIANILSVHYLGVSSLTTTWNLRMLDKIFRDVLEGEKRDQPCLISLAMTEPDAGTDVQNIELMDAGNLGCRAEKVDSGYLLNGSKIFISMGHMSTWHIVNAYSDLEKPSENMVVLAVKSGTQGFSLGKKEDKMGQLGCPASELIFKDCLVPEENVCIDSSQTEGLHKGIKGTNEQILASLWGASRMGVASFGAGAARGAYQEAVKFAQNQELNGEPLINQQWCQSKLTDMYKNVAISRSIYLEATYANAMHGLWKTLNSRPIYYLIKIIPAKLLHIVVPPICKKKLS
ncbi:MAG: acyl-CoA dehydrogenase family protein, partial [Thermodesulfobacteriota bacterium]